MTHSMVDIWRIRKSFIAHQERYIIPQGGGVFLVWRDLALLKGHILLPNERYIIPDVLFTSPDVPTAPSEVTCSPS